MSACDSLACVQAAYVATMASGVPRTASKAAMKRHSASMRSAGGSASCGGEELPSVLRDRPHDRQAGLRRRRERKDQPLLPLGELVDPWRPRRRPPESVSSSLVETFLQAAERHVAEGEARVAQQRARVDVLEQRGEDASLALGLLRTMEATLETMRQDLEVARMRRGGSGPR